MKNPTVSVVVPVYNGERYLKDSIESILNQTYRDFELILINDGSTDKTLEIIKQYQVKDSRVKVISFNTNRGLVSALNKGLESARGAYIARMDIDDISLPKRFEIQCDFLEKNKHIFLVCGSYEVIDSRGRVFTKVEKSFFLDHSHAVDHILDAVGFISHSTVMFRNTSRVLYREKAYCAEDRDLWLLLLSQGKSFFMLKDIVLKYRIHHESLSTQKYEYQAYVGSVADRWFLERVYKGRDSYDQFRIDEYKKKTQVIFSTEAVVRLRTLSQLFVAESKDSKIMREYIYYYWKIAGFFKNKRMILSYIATYFSFSTKKRVKSFIRQIKNFF